LTPFDNAGLGGKVFLGHRRTNKTLLWPWFDLSQYSRCSDKEAADVQRKNLQKLFKHNVFLPSKNRPRTGQWERLPGRMSKCLSNRVLNDSATGSRRDVVIEGGGRREEGGGRRELLVSYGRFSQTFSMIVPERNNQILFNHDDVHVPR